MELIKYSYSCSRIIDLLAYKLKTIQMIMAEMDKHPDSYMNDGTFLNKLLIPVSDGYLNVYGSPKENRIT